MRRRVLGKALGQELRSRYWKAGGWTLGLVVAGMGIGERVAVVHSQGMEADNNCMRVLLGSAAGTVEVDRRELGLGQMH